MPRDLCRALTIALVSLLAEAACVGEMAEVQRAIDRYDASLQLEVVLDGSTSIIDALLPVTLNLRNAHGREEIRACVGSRAEFVLAAVPLVMRDKRPPVAYAGGRWIDHSGCERRFRLKPGETFSWHESLSAKDIGAGGAELLASIEVVYPLDCHPLYGCYGTMIKAAPVALQLERGHTRE
jgi:hypothetical protein